MALPYIEKLMHPKDADRMANSHSIDPDQSSLGLLCLSENLGSVRYFSNLIIRAVTWQNQQNACVPSEDSDQPGHPPSLIRISAVCMKKACILSYPLSASERLWSVWVDAQADLSHHRTHIHFVGVSHRGSFNINSHVRCCMMLRRNNNLRLIMINLT